jgi:putative aminopeptidase FrvX
LTIYLPLGYNSLTLAHSPGLHEYALAPLWELLALDSPSGDEGPLADWLETYLAREVPDARFERLGDSLIVRRGEQPTVAVFAHTDTTGWMLGYDKQLIAIGGPSGKPGDLIRSTKRPDTGNKLTRRKDGSWKVRGKTDAVPGSRWVYAALPKQDGDEIIGPYLDNRAGMWAALHVLRNCPMVAVAFTSYEETRGVGALLCARRLYETNGIMQALISDLTWHTKHVRCGHGPAVSLRDSCLPRQRFLQRVLALADTSGLPYQREIEDSGGSDGASLDRSGIPMDWVFVGAPEHDPHTACERVHTGDLQGMAGLLVHLVNELSEGG